MFVFLFFPSDKGVGFNLTANYGGFNTTYYRYAGCQSSICEGVEELRKLNVSS